MARTVAFDCVSPHCDFDFEDSKPIFFAWHSGLLYTISLYKVWLQKVQQFRRYPEKTFKLSTFAVTLILNTAIQSFAYHSFYRVLPFDFFPWMLAVNFVSDFVKEFTLGIDYNEQKHNHKQLFCVVQWISGVHRQVLIGLPRISVKYCTFSSVTTWQDSACAPK